MHIGRVSDNACSPPNESPYDPRHPSEFVCDSQVGSATLPGAPKHLSGALTCSQHYQNHSHRTPVSVIRDPSYSISKKYFSPGGMAPSEWTRSVRAVRDTPVAGYSAPGLDTTRRVAYCPPIAVSPFLLALSVSYFKRTLWRCGQL